ncbi:Txe/YoeB family addiction module toxin [Treponema pedis]|uniref:Putative mRNA interferase YoeB n=1 Tax=Treponema pedis TaxID=409322 RepID=A0A7S6WQC6_9SPIR|nr:Txe/YoeB family addiction module toxin [Treponema pedis]QOW60797.1 Txe/YoeB family addiction module toxin [Treponema pedis]QSI04163.1 Txe/YoeB family addiction module toxin [Treponema pedis]
MKIQFDESAWEQFQYWQEQDKKTLKKINKLIEDISRNGNKGLGRPEPLKGNLTGLWSREIDKKNRLIYVIEDDTLTIIQCKNHYKDK